MGVVTGLSTFRGLTRVSVDGRVFLSLNRDAFSRFPLQLDEAIDEEAYENRVAAYQFKTAYQKGVELLAACGKSEAQLRAALLRRGFVTMAVEAAIDRLREARLLDDAALSKRIVELSEGKPVGRYALKRKLRAKGFSEEDAQTALLDLSDDDQREGAYRMGEKLLRRYADESPFDKKRKLSQALARRGFSWDDISAALCRLLSSDYEE